MPDCTLFLHLPEGPFTEGLAVLDLGGLLGGRVQCSVCRVNGQEFRVRVVGSGFSV